MSEIANIGNAALGLGPVFRNEFRTYSWPSVLAANAVFGFGAFGLLEKLVFEGCDSGGVEGPSELSSGAMLRRIDESLRVSSVLVQLFEHR